MTEYIKRQDAIDAIKSVPTGNWSSKRYAGEIERIQPADVRPVVPGRWIKKYENPLDGTFYCSNCKEEIDIADGGDTPLKRGMYYCHNCGADLRGAKKMLDVTVFLKSGKSFTYGENAVFEDKEAHRIVLATGKVSGGRLNGGWGTGVSKYRFDETSHAAWEWSDVDRIEIRER